jgi:DNA-binding NarL/FixJ family response regulator
MASNPRVAGSLGTVLIVDDSGYARLRLRRFLLERGWRRIVEASDGDQALQQLARHQPCLVLMDQVMRGRPGIETAELMLAHNAHLNIIMLTVVSDRGFHQQALHAGVKKVLLKKDLNELGASLRELGHE